jgi:hypothetical protein
MDTMNKSARIFLFGIGVCLSIFPGRIAGAQSERDQTGMNTQVGDLPSTASIETSPQVVKKHGLGHKLFWYIPNRVMDVVDIFRVRARAGLGLAANVRITDYADVYMGQYNSVYVGLPGPRMGPERRRFAGREQEKGLKLLGVDASDDLPHDPGYSPTEFNLGVHLLIVGAEIGFDPVELGDFLAGLFMIDVREDDR